MSRRPLLLVLMLTVADYLLWSWSLAHGPQVVAIFCGVLLVPLLLALAWMLVLGVIRLLGGHLYQRAALSRQGRLAPRVPAQRRLITDRRRLVMRRANRARRVARGAGMRRATTRTPLRAQHAAQGKVRQPKENSRAPSSDRLAA